MKCSGARSFAADSISADCSGCRKRVEETCVSGSRCDENKKRKCMARVSAAVLELNHVGTPMISRSSGCRCDFMQLEAGRVYTIGRSNQLCDFVVNLPRVSRQHCKIFLDSSCCKIFIVDGGCVSNSSIRNLKEKEEDEEEERPSGSLNGVFVNGVRCKIGEPSELSIGDEVSLVCARNWRDSHSKIGFSIREVVFLEKERGIFPNHGDFSMIQRSFSPQRISSKASSGSKRIFASRSCYGYSGSCSAISRAKSLLGQCRHILSSSDPISCIIRCPIYFEPLVEAPFACNGFPGSNLDFISRKPASPTSVAKTGSGNIFPVQRQELLPHSSSNNDSDKQASFHAECLSERANSSLKNFSDDENNSSLNSSPIVSVRSHSDAFNNKIRNDSRVQTLKKNFCLNRLGSAKQGSVGHRSDISLPDLLYPVQSILRILVATFTSDIEWFLSYCQIPCQMPVIIACHDTDRCWCSSPDKRTLVPYPEFPNVEVVFPPFPENIAFGKDRKKHGIACHHPKLIVVQREDRIRVVITSANLVPRQWVSITNTIWWQDFPQRSAPDYMSLFTRITDEERSNRGSNSDFAAQLAGFMACLLIDNPRQAHWITELTKYDFQGANGYLITSVPGIHSYRLQWESAMTSFSMDDRDTSCSRSSKLLATVEASVVGLSYFFRTASDSNGATLKKLAAFLLNSRVSASGMLEILLRRNTNVARRGSSRSPAQNIRSPLQAQKVRSISNSPARAHSRGSDSGSPVRSISDKSPSGSPPRRATDSGPARVSRSRSRSRSLVRSRRNISRSPQNSIRRSVSKSPARSARRSISRSQLRSSRRSISKSPVRPPRRSISRSPIRPTRRSISRSPVRPSRRSTSPSPVRSTRKSLSRSPEQTSRRSISRSPVRPSRRSISRSPSRSSRRSIGRSPVRPARRSISRSPVRPARRSLSRSPVRPARRSISRSRSPPIRRARSPPSDRRRSYSRSVSPDGSPKRIKRGRGFSERYSYARRYRTPSPDPPVRSYRYRDRYSRYRRYSPRRYRSPARGRTPLRYRSRRSPSVSPGPRRGRRYSRSSSPSRDRSPAKKSHLPPRAERERSYSKSASRSVSRSSRDSPSPSRRAGKNNSRSSSSSPSPSGKKALVNYEDMSPDG